MGGDPFRVVVASTNPVKIAAVAAGYRALFPDYNLAVEGIAVPSGVAHQPVGDAETLAGARNRAAGARERVPDADAWVGIEGGIIHREGGMEAFAWLVVLGIEGRGESRTGGFMLPPGVAALIAEGMELGHANDRIFGTENSKHDQGAIGLLTGGVIDRTALHTHGMILALVPFRRGDLYPPG